MVEISDVVLCSPESIRLMDNEFGFVVESFNGAVVDGHLEVVEEVVLVTTQHPSEVAYRGKARMRRPPEPFLQIPPSPAGAAVIPEVAEELLEEGRLG